MKKWIMYVIISIISIVGIIDIFLLIKIYQNTNNIEMEPNKELADLQNSNIEISNILETSYTSTKVSPKAKLTFETMYLGCNHKDVKEEIASENMVNKNEYDVTEAYKTWEIKKFSSDNIIFYKEVDKMCGNDYIIKEQNGFINIFRIDTNGEEVLHERTNIEVQYLPDTDALELKNGIRVNGIDKVSKILEDFE